jgi:hypothetical protein
MYLCLEHKRCTNANVEIGAVMAAQCGKVIESYGQSAAGRAESGELNASAAYSAVSFRAESRRN